MLQCCNVSLRITIPRDCYPQANIATLQHCNIATLLTIQQLGDCYPQANIATLQHCQIANNPIILTIQQCNKVGGTGGLPKNASESHSVDGVLRDNGPKEYHCHALRYIYIYMCVYVYVQVYLYAYVYAYVYVHAYVYVYSYVQKSVALRYLKILPKPYFWGVFLGYPPPWKGSKTGPPNLHVLVRFGDHFGGLKL